MRYKHCVLYLFSAMALWILPSCSGSKKTEQQPDSSNIKILSYNIRNARGMDDITDFDRVANVINRINADCVAIQELDSATERSNGIIVLDELATRTGMYASYNKSIDYRGGGYGIGILTKEKPLRKEAIPLPGREEQRSLLVVELPDYIVCCTHWSLKQPDRLSSVDEINQWVQKYDSKPVFLAGDLNAVPESEEIRKLSGTWTILNNTSQPTSPADHPRRCIDYVLVKNNPTFNIHVLETKVENEPMASDHSPVWIRLSVN